MNLRALFYLLFFTLIILTTSCYRIKPSNGGGQIQSVKERKVNPADIAVPEGYKIEVVATGLNYPTGIAFDKEGSPYITEAGYSYGEVWTEPKIVKLDNGKSTVIASGDKNGPWNGIYYDNGFFYVAEGGVLEGGKILKISEDGEITTLAENLPSMGDHHTNGPVVKDGYVYFGQGTATNSGVVGTDNYEYGWLKRFPDFHDIPCKDIVLNGVNFKSENPLTDQKDEAVTGAYVPFGQKTKDGEVISGKIPCSGAILKVPVSGGQPELVAWGLRNPYSLAFNPDGKLYVAENSFDVRGNRPIWGAGDNLYEIKEGLWYGWPDYAAGRAVYGRDEFKTPGCKPAKKLLKNNPNEAPKALAEFGVHSSTCGMDVITNAAFGNQGHILLAQFGDLATDVGKTWSPVGFQVVKTDPETGVIEIFAANNVRKNGPASWIKNQGLERPIAVRFDPSGETLYIVDFGILTIDKDKGAIPIENSGVVWKITKTK